MSVGPLYLCHTVKTTFPNIQNMHENAVIHNDSSNHDDPYNHEESSRECKNVLKCARKAF